MFWKISTLEGVFEKLCFHDMKRHFGVDWRTKRRKNTLLRQYPVSQWIYDSRRIILINTPFYLHFIYLLLTTYDSRWTYMYELEGKLMRLFCFAFVSLNSLKCLIDTFTILINHVELWLEQPHPLQKLSPTETQRETDTHTHTHTQTLN